MFVTRLVSGIILVIIALVTIGRGGLLLAAALLATSLAGLSEIYRATNVRPSDSDKISGGGVLLAGVGFLGAVCYYILLYLYKDACSMMCLLFTLMAMLSVYVFTYPRYSARQVMAAFFGVVYVAVMLSYIYLIREARQGVFLVWLVFLSSWGCDTCAYCVGMLIGKHKMSPVLSPKKSVEGAVGGVLGAGLLGVLYALLAGPRMGVQDAAVPCAAVCAVGALISMVGDLAASAIKRNHGIKDYGTLIPGHGGILDRFDSVIFTAPVIWFLSDILFK